MTKLVALLLYYHYVSNVDKLRASYRSVIQIRPRAPEPHTDDVTNRVVRVLFVVRGRGWAVLAGGPMCRGFVRVAPGATRASTARSRPHFMYIYLFI